MKKTSMTYLAAIAVFLSSALCAVHAAPSDDIGAVRRLEAEYVAQGGSERLEAWRKGLDDYNNAYGRTLDAALLKARFHYFGEGNACAAIDSLKPYMHYASSRPEIPYFIWMMCGDIPHGGSAALQPLLNDSAFEHKGDRKSVV